MITLPKTHMNPEKGTLKDCFPIYKPVISGSMIRLDG